MNRSRPSSVTFQDLELRLGSSMFKGGMLASNFNRGYPEIILIEDDDDDDMQIYTSGPPDQSFRPLQYSSHWESVIGEEDLELHLGVRTSGNSNSNRRDAKIQDPNVHKSTKASSSPRPYGNDEVNLRCSICMDNNEGGDIHHLRPHFLQHLHHQCHPRVSKMPDLPVQSFSEQYSSNISPRSKFLMLAEHHLDMSSS